MIVETATACTKMKSSIPPAVREQLRRDTFMRQCCLASSECLGRVQWHHNLIHAYRAVQEWWAILPVCEWHHSNADRKDFKRELNFIMVERAKDLIEPYEKLRKFPRRN